MSYFGAFGTEDGEDLIDTDDIASNSGWAAFGEWAHALPGEYPELGYLGDHGEVYAAPGDPQDALEALEDDLKRAMREKPGRPSSDVLTVAARLLLILEQRPDQSIYFVVTDGTEGDDESGEGDDEEDEPAAYVEKFAAGEWVAWTISRGPRKGIQGWKNSSSGKIIVGDKPGTKKAAPDKPASKTTPKPKAAPKPPKAKAPTVDEMHGHLTDLLSTPDKITPEVIKETAKKLMELTVANLTALKKKFEGIKASGKKEDLATKIAERVLAKPAEKPAAKPAEKPSARKPAPKPSAQPASQPAEPAGEQEKTDPLVTAGKISNMLRSSVSVFLDKSKPLGDRLNHLADLDTAVMDAAYNSGLLQEAQVPRNNEFLRAAHNAFREWEDGLKSPEDKRRLAAKLDAVQLDMEKAAAGMRKWQKEGKSLEGYLGPIDLTAAATLYDTLGEEAMNEVRAAVGLPQAGTPEFVKHAQETLHHLEKRKADLEQQAQATRARGNGRRADELAKEASFVNLDAARKLMDFAKAKAAPATSASTATGKTAPKPSAQPAPKAEAKPTPRSAPAARQDATTAKPASSSPAEHVGKLVDIVKQVGGTYNHASLVDVRKALADHGIKDRKEQDQAIQDARKKGMLSASALEGRQGISPEQREAAIKEPGSDHPIGYLSIREK